jgi:hypothetical protein
MNPTVDAQTTSCSRHRTGLMPRTRYGHLERFLSTP